eukprot:TRINITY_DN2275_c0_g2_i5.p1 TRINITY_DN2275_c0_g2~~TRINITY_DN2275_c0_g2_i5.p1  ORF type:complete len:642 (+),score=230.21 TRINITY_DN2275_c0_g2_i5:77-1927(+)
MGGGQRLQHAHEDDGEQPAGCTPEMQLADGTKEALAGLLLAHGQPILAPFVCPGCAKHTFGPSVVVTAPCGHHFHQPCIEHALKSDDGCCPCKEAFPPGQERVTPVSHLHKKMMNSVEVQCPQSCGEVMCFELLHGHVHNAGGCTETPFRCGNEGCGAVFPRRDTVAHLRSCTHCLIPCELCEQRVKRGELQHHLSSACPRRTVRCDHCKKEHIQCEKEEHMRGCTGAVLVKDIVQLREGMCQPVQGGAHSVNDVVELRQAIVRLDEDLQQQKRIGNQLQQCAAEQGQRLDGAELQQRAADQRAARQEEMSKRQQTQIDELSERIREQSDRLEAQQQTIEQQQQRITSLEEAAKGQQEAMEEAAKAQHEALEAAAKAQREALEQAVKAQQEAIQLHVARDQQPQQTAKQQEQEQEQQQQLLQQQHRQGIAQQHKIEQQQQNMEQLQRVIERQQRDIVALRSDLVRLHAQTQLSARPAPREPQLVQTAAQTEICPHTTAREDAEPAQPPGHLVVTGCGKVEYNGQYSLLDKRVNGAAVWGKGAFRVFRTRQGHWGITQEESGPQRNRGEYRLVAQPGGPAPLNTGGWHFNTEDWDMAREDGWQRRGSVSVAVAEGPR